MRDATHEDAVELIRRGTADLDFERAAVECEVAGDLGDTGAVARSQRAAVVDKTEVDFVGVQRAAGEVKRAARALRELVRVERTAAEVERRRDNGIVEDRNFL